MISVSYRGNPEYESQFSYQTSLSAGVDLVAQQQVVLDPGYTAVVSTGVFIDSYHFDPELPWIPSLQVLPRSGLSARTGLRVANAPGLIDADYKEEIKVILFNAGRDTEYIRAGDRIAQLVGVLLFRISGAGLLQIERSGGFGSTDVVPQITEGDAIVSIESQS